jgi:hypothetical protein
VVLGNHYGGSGLIIGKKLQLQALREGNQFEEYLRYREERSNVNMKSGMTKNNIKMFIPQQISNCVW